MSDPAIGCLGVVKHFGGTPILDGINLEVRDRSVIAILGASGSGKTTLLRIIMGFVAADSGTVAVNGRQVSDGLRLLVPAEKRNIGYVAQEGALFPHLTVGQNIAFGLPRSERKSTLRISELLELLGLGSDFSDRHPHQLSGGEQRRVALARALAPRPKAILLDEPFTGLDAALRAETRAAVVGALGNEGTAAVLVTHDPAEALSIGEEVAVLREGRLVQTATPSVLYQTPIDLATAAFVGDTVILPGDASGGFVICALGKLELHGPAHGMVHVMVRPEQIRLSSNPSDPRAIVVGATYFGRQTMLTLRVEANPPIDIRAPVADQDVPQVGARVSVGVSGKAVAYSLP